jgi:hypothetical protein
LITNKEFESLVKKAYHPSKLTDKELAQLYRSTRGIGSHLLYKINKEMDRRGLLRKDWKGCGYAPEIKKNLRDY